jgi:hypothetical protein
MGLDLDDLALVQLGKTLDCGVEGRQCLCEAGLCTLLDLLTLCRDDVG